MSEQERLNLREKLNMGLKESYEKMLRLKLKLGEPVVTTDVNGNPITISAEEAWQKYTDDKSSDDTK